MDNNKWMKNKAGKRQILINIAVLVLILYGVTDLLTALQIHFLKTKELLNYFENFIGPDIFAVHRVLEITINFIFIFLSYRLYKRMRMAWFIVIALIPISMILNMIKYKDFITGFSLVEIFIFVVLAVNYKDFNRSSNPISFKVGASMSLISISLLAINTILGIDILQNGLAGLHNLKISFVDSFNMMFFMDFTNIHGETKLLEVFSYSAFVLNWICIISALIFLLKPLVYQPLMTKMDSQKVRVLFNLYSDNSIAYLAVEEDKKYFFSSSENGVIAYTIAAGVAVCVGDPICDEEEWATLMAEFMAFCKYNELDICFCQTTDRFIEQFKSLGFGVSKYGDEAMFKLSEYTLDGSKMQKIRSAINTATRKGITVSEYNPRIKRDSKLEERILAVSKEWLEIKKTKELTFMLGTVGLSNPMDKRYFYADNAEGELIAFVVFTPFRKKKGYIADVTRRKQSAPIGTMEMLIVKAFQKMNEEGVIWGSLGLAPLANLSESDEKNRISDRALNFIYEKMNSFYGFKALHHYKKKYNPTYWEPRYLVYSSRIFTPKIAYSIIKAQNPSGVGDMIFTQLKQTFGEKQIAQEKE